MDFVEAREAAGDEIATLQDDNAALTAQLEALRKEHKALLDGARRALHQLHVEDKATCTDSARCTLSKTINTALGREETYP